MSLISSPMSRPPVTVLIVPSQFSYTVRAVGLDRVQRAEFHDELIARQADMRLAKRGPGGLGLCVLVPTRDDRTIG